MALKFPSTAEPDGRPSERARHMRLFAGKGWDRATGRSHVTFGLSYRTTPPEPPGGRRVIPARAGYPNQPLHRVPVRDATVHGTSRHPLRGRPAACPGAERMASETPLVIDWNENYTDEHVDAVAAALRAEGGQWRRLPGDFRSYVRISAIDRAIPGKLGFGRDRYWFVRKERPMGKLAKASLAAAAGLVLAGCGSGGGTGSESGKSTVTLWMYPVIQDTAKNQAFWQKIEKDFEAKNADVDLKIDLQPWEGRQEKVTTALVSKTGFDLVVLGPDQVPQYAQQGTIEALDDVVAPAKASYLPNSLTALTVNGTLYGVPIYQTITAPIFNKKAFADAGVTEIPDTLEELKAAAPKLAAKKVAVLDYPGKPEVSLNQSFYPLLWANGGSVFAADGKSVAFNGPEGVEALQLLVDLKKAGGLPADAASKGNEIEGGPLASGKSALYHAATALQATQLGAAIGEENVGVGLPLEGKKRVAFGIPGGLVLAKHSPNKEAAKKFVNYLSSAEVSADLAKESGFFPARTDAAVAEQSEIAKEFAKSLEFAFPGDTHPQARQVMAALAPHIQSALLGKADAKAALDAAAKEANALLGGG
ncbi:ABC transporter substrate-binding protein [Sinosporangium siamense]|uniref:Sugar ABC transporter substrate-binding protein n=1 Tax=Sinosporangium siamense TaxID=1367973 RepID=A0A919RFJ7_9ACTN|nr:sugar ABC transporter substrate-binding protein [Sinosporangium siamense]GII92980.1 hypothetical protein Ssi02_32110 [Sinosporangium siamense]